MQLPSESPHPDQVLAMIWAFERAKSLCRVDEGGLAPPKPVAGGSGNPSRVPRKDVRADVPLLCALIRDYGLPHECVPTEMKRHPEVWAALLPDMGLTAILRNLGTMTEVGLLSTFSSVIADFATQTSSAG